MLIDPARDRFDHWARWGVFALWLAIVLVLAWHHVPWRDEVRALSFARGGQDPMTMIRHIGDGHPAMWFLLLRGAFDLTGTTLVLPVLALLVATATMLLVVARAPYRWWQIALFSATQFMLFEYPVVARNYGISVLLMAALAALPDRWRGSGWWPGLLLALLANSNVHSVIFVFGYLAILRFDRRPGEDRPARAWRISAGLAAIGILICIASVYPPLNTAAREDMPIPSLAAMFVAMVVPALQFGELTTNAAALGHALPATNIAFQLLALATSALLVAACFAPDRSRGSSLAAPLAAPLAAAFALYALVALFLLVYPGSYRHQALWLVFVLSLDWMQRNRHPLPQTRITRLQRIGRRQRIGAAALLLLVALQVPVGLATAWASLNPAMPYARSADLARLIRADPALASAIILSEPDYLIESLPYYLTNPLYLPREHRFGSTAQFDRQARLDYSVGAMVEDARRLRTATRRPVLLLIQRDTGTAAAPPALPKARSFTMTAADRTHLHACTQLLGRFGPATSGETYAVFLLPTAPRPACA